ncbi:MAG TPA: histidine kinase [Chthonomonadaceae bacterium]|nr:histidine kinase [Chthonomonadaceae bacterium]
MTGSFQAINAFIEDTCVIIVVAYLLARGRMLAMVFDERRTRQQLFGLGVVFGLIGITEIVFPGARYPYVTNTLIVSFAAYMVGLLPALVATVLIALLSLLFQPAPAVLRTLGMDLTSALVGAAFGALFARRKGAWTALATGICVQAIAAGLVYLSAASELAHSAPRMLLSIPANGLGMLLLLLVLHDARVRAESEKHKTEAERSHALVAEAQMRALRANVHPHFLFNSLTSIAALCGIAPEKAERAVMRLSQLMRRSLGANLDEPVRIDDEMQYVDGYIEIEQYRYGPRLQVHVSIDPAGAADRVPAYAIQTLVDNAINHGIAAKSGPVNVWVTVAARRDRTVIAVSDDGRGIDAEARTVLAAAEERAHGLGILSAQLALLYGPRARVRLFRRPSGGTLATFAVPARCPEER